MVDRSTVQSLKLVKDSQQTKKPNVDILHGINLFTYFNDIWHYFICWTDDKKSLFKRVLRAWELQISDF